MEKRKRTIETENGRRTSELTYTDFRKKYPEGQYNYDKKKRVYTQDVYYGVPKYAQEYRKAEFEEESKDDKTIYRTSQTYLYSKNNLHEEFRISIYTTEPDVTYSECDDVMNKFFDDNGFFVDWNKVIGNELNEEVPTTGERTGIFNCAFLKNGKVVLKKNYTR